MPETPLTLKECLAQPHGTAGRLFEAPSEDLSLFFEHSIVGAYRVTEIGEGTLDIEGYTYGGNTKSLKGIPLNPRSQDRAMPSEKLLDFYVSLGQEIARRNTTLTGR